jgi:hypothetical protein
MAIAQVDASCPPRLIWFAGTTRLPQFCNRLPHGFAGSGSGHCFSALNLGERMQPTTISATALEKLKRLAKQHRDTTGQPLAVSLEAVAQQAGYLSWKQVTMLANAHKPVLMPASHNWRGHWADDGGPRMRKCTTVEELCEVLGGVEPVLLRSRCHESSPGARCLCELDPFVTAKHANAAIDIGDKYDYWHYLYLPSKPYSGSA